MKKIARKILLFNIIISTIFITACGKNSDNKVSTTDSEKTNTEVSSVEVATTETPTTEAAGLTQEWIDTLYGYLMAGDWNNGIRYAGVKEDILPYCSDYRLDDWTINGYEYAYIMKTSNDNILGIIIYDQDKGFHFNEIYVFTCTQENIDHGLDSVGYGDTLFSYSYTNEAMDINMTTSLFNNHFINYESDFESDFGENDPAVIWHT